MSMTRESSALHQAYEDAETSAPEVAQLVDRCWNAVRDVIKADGREIDGTDNAEILVAYIWQYVTQCPKAR